MEEEDLEVVVKTELLICGWDEVGGGRVGEEIFWQGSRLILAWRG